MAEPASVSAFRAAVDALFPASEDRPGALELRADEHVLELVELGLPAGFPELITALLDAYAGSVRPGTAFSDLDAEDRVAVLRAMSADPVQDTKDAADLFWIFTLGAMYSEWGAYDPAAHELGSPPMWADVGYPGPSVGYPDFREDA